MATNTAIRRPLMINAMPSSGSDWFVSCLQAACPEIVCHPTAKEFFNPLCNLEHYDAMSKVFGCETVDCYKNITRLIRPEEAEPFVDMFMSQELTMTKEVWSAWHGFMFGRWFDVVGFVRRPENTFPPTRIRVWSWYRAVAASLGIDGDLKSSCLRAHDAMWKEIQHSLLDIYLPTIQWEKCMSYELDQLDKYFNGLLPSWIPCRRLAEIICETRRLRA